MKRLSVKSSEIRELFTNELAFEINLERQIEIYSREIRE